MHLKRETEGERALARDKRGAREEFGLAPRVLIIEVKFIKES